MLNCSASLAMSTSVLKALPGKLDIKRHSPSILYIESFWLSHQCTVKPVLSGHKRVNFQDWYLLSAGQKYRMLPWNILQYFRPALSYHMALLNLLNELGKRDKMRGLPSIYLFFTTRLINSIKQEHERSIYHMAFRLLWNLISAVKFKNVILLSLCTLRNVVMDVITFPINL